MKTIFDIAFDELISIWEGFRSYPYYCSAGKLTIGFGRVILANDKIGRYSGAELLSLCKGKSEDYLERKYSGLVTRESSKKWAYDRMKANWREITPRLPLGLSDNQCAVLLSFMYNFNPYKLRKSTLLKKLHLGDHEGAGLELLRWVYIDENGESVVSTGLENRREAELALWKK